MNFQAPSQNSKIVNGDFELERIISSLWRGKWVVLVFVLCCVFVADFYVRRIAVPLYSATAKLVLQEDKLQIISNIENIISGGPLTNMNVMTELEVLRSGYLVGQLVDYLKLMNEPEFNYSLQSPKLSDLIKTQFTTFLGVVPEKPASVSSQDLRSSVINSVIKSMTISNPRNTLVMNISFTTNDTALSAQMAETMAEIYIENKIKIKRDAHDKATKFLSVRTLELKQNFENLKSKKAQFLSQSKLVNADVLEAEEIKLRELRLSLSKLIVQSTEKEKALAKLQFFRKSANIKALITAANDFRLSRTISQYNENLISLNDLNLEVDRFMLEREADAGRGQKKLLALRESVTLLTKKIERQSQELIVLQQLERETDAARILYESLSTRLLEINVQLGLENADVRILSEADSTGQSNQKSPKKGLILLLATSLGLIMGFSFILFREMRFEGFRSPNDLSNNSGYWVLGSVPLIPSRERKSVISFFQDKPNSVFSEAVRNLRTSILMPKTDIAPQVIMMTSSVPREGKTTLTFALAKNLVGLGKRVILIEADIRSSNHSVDIDRKNTVALIDLLTGDRDFINVNPFVEELGFDILSGSKSNINAADLFASESFAKLLTELRKNYDYILIDTPPVLFVPDARLIGINCDATIYVVKWNTTTKGQVYQGLDMLSSVGINTIGVVLNQINSKKMKYYGYAGQYGYDVYVSKYYDG